jgi:hypothetical protein
MMSIRIEFQLRISNGGLQIGKIIFGNALLEKIELSEAPRPQGGALCSIFVKE